MPQVKITLNDDSLAFMEKHKQFSKSDIINAAIAAINRVNDSDADNRTRLGLVMVGAGVVVDAEAHLRSLLLASPQALPTTPSPTPAVAQTPAQAPAQTQSVTQSVPKPPAEPQAPAIPPTMVDPRVTKDDLVKWAAQGWTPPPGVPLEQLNKDFVKHVMKTHVDRHNQREAERATQREEKDRMDRYARRGLRPHDIAAAETLRQMANAVEPVMNAIIQEKPPAEPGPLPEIEPRVYEAVGPTGVRYPLTKEEWEAIKDEMTPGMQEAFATRDQWYFQKAPLMPWQMMVKNWLENGDNKGQRAQFIPKQKPKPWSLVETYQVNEPGLDEVCPEGWTFSSYCFHADYYGSRPRFGWVRRFKNPHDDNHLYFSFHDVLRALGVGQFKVWLADLDLPRGLYDQWKEVSDYLDDNPLDDGDIEHDAFDLDKRYKAFPPELSFLVHEGILWLNLRGLFRIKDTVMRVLGDEDYDEYVDWITNIADIRAYDRLYPRSSSPEGLKLPD